MKRVDVGDIDLVTVCLKAQKVSLLLPDGVQCGPSVGSSSMMGLRVEGNLLQTLMLGLKFPTLMESGGSLRGWSL